MSAVTGVPASSAAAVTTVNGDVCAAARPAYISQALAIARRNMKEGSAIKRAP
jgi:hypothetical protein